MVFWIIKSPITVCNDVLSIYIVGQKTQQRRGKFNHSSFSSCLGVVPLSFAVHPQRKNVYPGSFGVYPQRKAVYPETHGVYPEGKGVVPKRNGDSSFSGFIELSIDDLYNLSVFHLNSPIAILCKVIIVRNRNNGLLTFLG